MKLVQIFSESTKGIAICNRPKDSWQTVNSMRLAMKAPFNNSGWSVTGRRTSQCVCLGPNDGLGHFCFDEKPMDCHATHSTSA